MEAQAFKRNDIVDPNAGDKAEAHVASLERSSGHRSASVRWNGRGLRPQFG
jgi:hypothetical protein